MQRAILKYRRSVEFQEELQKARMDQKKKDKADNQKKGLLTITAKLKTSLKLMPKEIQEQMVNKFGLHKIQEQMDNASKPEMRPKWVNLPSKARTRAGRVYLQHRQFHLLFIICLLVC